MEDSLSLTLLWYGRQSVRRLCHLAFVDRLGNEPKSERADYLSDRIELGLRRTAQRFVEAFSGKTCFLCDLRHAFGPGDRIKCIADEFGIVGRQCLRKIVGHRLRALEIICSVEF